MIPSEVKSWFHKHENRLVLAVGALAFGALATLMATCAIEIEVSERARRESVAKIEVGARFDTTGGRWRCMTKTADTGLYSNGFAKVVVDTETFVVIEVEYSPW